MVKWDETGYGAVKEEPHILTTEVWANDMVCVE